MAAPGAEKREAAAKATEEKASAEAAPVAAPKKAPSTPKSGGRKTKDKWKAKEWYNVHAPHMFNETVIGETPASDPSYLIGRQAEVTVADLIGDASKAHIKLLFKISDVDGHEAKTEFVGHTLTSDYVRRLTRRKKTKTDHVVDVRTADGYVIRIKTMSIADRRIQTSQEEAMRRAIGEFLTLFVREHKLSQVIRNVISNDLAREVGRACKVVIPVKRIEIRRTEILRKGNGEPDSIIAAPVEGEPAEAIVEDVAPAEESE